MKVIKNERKTRPYRWIIAGLILVIIVLLALLLRACPSVHPGSSGGDPHQAGSVCQTDFERQAFLHSLDPSSVKTVFVDFEDDHKNDIEIVDPKTVFAVADSFFGEEMAYEGVNLDHLDPVFRSMTVTFRTAEEEYMVELYSWTIYNGAENEDYIRFDGTLFYPTGEHDYYSVIMKEYNYQTVKANKPSYVP